MIVLSAIISAAAAYLIGSISSAVIISKLLYKEDIRTKGSGNAGATNMLRVHGKKMGVIVLVIDLLKGVAAVCAAYIIRKLLCGNANADVSMLYPAIPAVAALFVSLGHDFPVFFGFRGGKGVATGLGAMLALHPLIAVCTLVTALIIMAVTRYVSLGSILGALIFDILVIIKAASQGGSVLEIIFCTAVVALLIARHHANISRLIKGCENKLGAGSAE